MRISLVSLFCLIQIIIHGQSFSEKWKADSLGTSGFRKNSVNWDSIKIVYLINGINFNGVRKFDVIRLLGEPNMNGSFQYSHGVGFFRSHTHATRQTFIYYLDGANSLTNESDRCLTLIIHKKKVYYLTEKNIKRFEYHKFLGCLLTN
jgi:hypothetical protein